MQRAHLPPAEADAAARKRRVLESALLTFLRFGFRKTSMDEVARAAGLSRQGLYLHYASKEDLFRATVAHALETALEAASAELESTAACPLAQRLSGAFEEWVGRFVGMVGDVADLYDASHRLVGPLIKEHDERFVERVAKVLRSSGLAAAYKPAGLSARSLAETLHATARGLKSTCTSRDEFRERFMLAARALCLPLAERA